MADYFRELREAWKPLYAPESRVKSVFVGDLPKPLYFEDGFLCYQNTKFNRKIVTCHLREERSDAWGASFELNDRVLFRWKHSLNDEPDWLLTTEKSRGYVCTSGNYLEVIEMVDDNTVEWTVYRYKDYSED